MLSDKKIHIQKYIIKFLRQFFCFQKCQCFVQNMYGVAFDKDTKLRVETFFLLWGILNVDCFSENMRSLVCNLCYTLSQENAYWLTVTREEGKKGIRFRDIILSSENLRYDVIEAVISFPGGQCLFFCEPGEIPVTCIHANESEKAAPTYEIWRS